MPIDPRIADRMSRIKLLLVDDEPYMRKVVRTMLMGLGFRSIHEANDGPAGLEMIRSVQPDLVIVDWEMPGLDGAGFTRMVRSPDTFPYPNVPIIMLTGHGEKSRVLEAVEVGVNGFLLKPVSAKALMDRVTSVLLDPRLLARTAGAGQHKFNTASVHTDNDRQLTSTFIIN